MSAFTGPLMIEEVKPGKRWKLLQPIVYEVKVEGSGHKIVVPPGFETDGTSLPAVLRLVLSVWGTYGRAAALHDYLYAVLREDKLWQGEDEYSVRLLHEAYAASGVSNSTQARAWADREFHTAMLACGTKPWLAWVMWKAVRVFGGFAVHARRREVAQQVAARTLASQTQEAVTDDQKIVWEIGNPPHWMLM